jgi:adenylyl- and sulfurtransferase ThiI
MRPAKQIVAVLRRAKLYDFVAEIAEREGVSVESLCSETSIREVSKPRQKIWARLAHHLESASKVARIWGVNHTTILYAIELASPEIIQVELARFDTERKSFSLEWANRPGGQFGVSDRVRERTTWFSTYQLAREVFSHVCEEAGQPTFRSAAAQGGAS